MSKSGFVVVYDFGVVVFNVVVVKVVVVVFLVVLLVVLVIWPTFIGGDNFSMNFEKDS